MTRWVVEHLGPDVPMHFTAFHPDYRMLDKGATPPATLQRARRIAIDNGVRYAYTGNVRDIEGGSTWCHACGEYVIARDGYVLGRYRTRRHRALHLVRHAGPRRVRRPGRALGPAPPAGRAARSTIGVVMTDHEAPVANGDAPRIRPPAVAGTFYPASPDDLRTAVRQAFAASVPPVVDAPTPEAIVVPHAGYVYSGAIAASAYARIIPARSTIRRVVLLGPSHRVYVRGLAVPSVDAFLTPLGVVPIDTRARDIAFGCAGVEVDDRAHADEHSLEVQLPFLQTVLDEFTLLPLSVGDATVDEVAAVLEALWDGPDSLVVVSTDLSHYHHYDDAARLDARTAAAIVARSAIDDHDACGARPLRGLLRVVTDHGLAVEQLDLRNSGDTSGDRHRVVGYGAFAVS